MGRRNALNNSSLKRIARDNLTVNRPLWGSFVFSAKSDGWRTSTGVEVVGYVLDLTQLPVRVSRLLFVPHTRGTNNAKLAEHFLGIRAIPRDLSDFELQAFFNKWTSKASLLDRWNFKECCH